ncbi:hypothetical protein PIB30_009559 [Stylosanthes scabra]|uniref:Uncharacterized protein n=1 Tax=Stylosanthes scabra TaxID=79078 RepID=A0ABU6Q535_9FABA|nr:hypothetical protein [Stylosanthes scabra]
MAPPTRTKPYWCGMWATKHPLVYRGRMKKSKLTESAGTDLSAPDSQHPKSKTPKAAASEE